MSRYKNKSGYIVVEAKDHPKAYYGKVLEHILIMEEYLGRPLPDGTIVHHRNRNRSDNRIENLLLLRNEDDHLALHRAMKSGNNKLVKAFEKWSLEFMEKLKAGLSEQECFSSSHVTPSEEHYRSKSHNEISPKPKELIKVKVIKVIDGDTVVVEDSTTYTQKVRLYGIDCPEDGQTWGEAASSALMKVILNRIVYLETYKLDDYDRLLATVHVMKENELLNVNEYMVRCGHAWVMPHFIGDLSNHRRHQLIKYQKWAAVKKLGLWQHPRPIPPWKWRKTNTA